jgi:integrase
MEPTHFLQSTQDDDTQATIQREALYQQSHDALVALQTRLLGELGAAADAYVQSNLFTQHQRRVAWNTVRKEIGTLSTFMIFLGLLQESKEQKDEEDGIPFQVLHLAEEPRLWSAITFGLVSLFLQWEQNQGYTIKTMNDHLDVIRRYSSLAQQAGYQTANQLTAIKGIARIRGSEAKRIDARREIARIGHKKADPTFLARKEFQVLLSRPDTPQGWRDRVAILLMYDLSLRPSEVVSLTIGHVNMEEGTIQITRHKTNDQQRARLKDRLYDAMRRYLGKREEAIRSW